MGDGSNGIKMALNSHNRQMDLSKTRVFIPPFEADSGPHPHVVRGIEQLITQQLSDTPGLEVSHYETVSPEKNPHCIDGEKDCWRLHAWRMGAHKVVFGTVGRLENQYVLNLKIIDSLTGKVERSVVGQPSGQNALRFQHDVTALANRLLGSQKRGASFMVRQTHHERDISTIPPDPTPSVRPESLLSVRPEPVEGRSNPSSFINWTAAIGFLASAGAFGYGAYYGFEMKETEVSFETLAKNREKRIITDEAHSAEYEGLQKKQWRQREEMIKGLIVGGSLTILSGILLYANYRTRDAAASPSLQLDIGPQKTEVSFKLPF